MMHHILPVCSKEVGRMIQESFMGVLMQSKKVLNIFTKRLKTVSSKFQGCFRIVLRRFQGSLRKFQGSFKEVSRLLQGNSKGVSIVFEERFDLKEFCFNCFNNVLR